MCRCFVPGLISSRKSAYPGMRTIVPFIAPMSTSLTSQPKTDA